MTICHCPECDAKDIDCNTQWQAEVPGYDEYFCTKIEAIAYITDFLMDEPNEDCFIREYDIYGNGTGEMSKEEKVWFDGHALRFEEIKHD